MTVPGNTNHVGFGWVLQGDIAHGGQLTLPYPSGYRATDFVGSPGDHFLFAAGRYFRVTDGDGKVAFAFGNDSFTITWNGGRTLRAGERILVGLQRNSDPFNVFNPPPVRGLSGMAIARYRIRPASSSVNAICQAQTRSSAGALTLNGSTVNGGVAKADVPRVVVLASSGNLSGVAFRIHGKDFHGRPVTVQYNGPNNGTVVTEVAFSEVTSVQALSGMGGVNIEVGWGGTFGLPCFLASAAHVLAGSNNGASATAIATPGHTGARNLTQTDPCGLFSISGFTPNGNNDAEIIYLTPSLDERGGAPFAM